MEAGAAIHGPLHGLDAIDLPLGGACGPGQVEGGLNGWKVPSYAGREVGKQGSGRVVEHASQAFPAWLLLGSGVVGSGPRRGTQDVWHEGGIGGS